MKKLKALILCSFLLFSCNTFSNNIKIQNLSESIIEAEKVKNVIDFDIDEKGNTYFIDDYKEIKKTDINGKTTNILLKDNDYLNEQGIIDYFNKNEEKENINYSKIEKISYNSLDDSIYFVEYSYDLKKRSDLRFPRKMLIKKINSKNEESFVLEGKPFEITINDDFYYSYKEKENSYDFDIFYLKDNKKITSKSINTTSLKGKYLQQVLIISPNKYYMVYNDFYETHIYSYFNDKLTQSIKISKGKNIIDPTDLKDVEDLDIYYTKGSIGSRFNFSINKNGDLYALIPFDEGFLDDTQKKLIKKNPSLFDENKEKLKNSMATLYKIPINEIEKNIEIKNIDPYIKNKFKLEDHYGLVGKFLIDNKEKFIFLGNFKVKIGGNI